MRESWRWFGPLDRIPLHEIAQTGATGIVNALHEVPYGEVWTVEAIRARQDLVAWRESVSTGRSSRACRSTRRSSAARATSRPSSPTTGRAWPISPPAA